MVTKTSLELEADGVGVHDRAVAADDSAAFQVA
jgi:hypothetical protein